MVLSSPRTLGSTPRRPGDRLVSVWLAAAVMLTFAAATAERAVGQRRAARASRRTWRSCVQTNGDFKPTTVIITATQAKVDRLAARHGLTVQQRLKTGAVLQVPAYRLGDAGGRCARSIRSRATTTCAGQMAMTNQAIGADQVQAGFAPGLRGLSGRGIGVAVIDSGVANVPGAERPHRRQRGLHGRAAARAWIDHGHGTHVAGIIAAAGQNANDDTRGVAPGAHIVSLKVLDAEGKGKAADVIAAHRLGDRASRAVRHPRHQPVAGRSRAAVVARRSVVPGGGARVSRGHRRRGVGRQLREGRQRPRRSSAASPFRATRRSPSPWAR